MAVLTYIASHKATELGKSERLQFIIVDFGVKYWQVIKMARKFFKKMKKVLDKTDLIRYNKRAVAENDNKTKNLDN